MCARFDNLVELEKDMETFLGMDSNFNPSVIPSHNREQTLLNSPPWKRKILMGQNIKKNQENVEEAKQQLNFEDSDDNNNNGNQIYMFKFVAMVSFLWL